MAMSKTMSVSEFTTHCHAALAEIADRKFEILVLTKRGRPIVWIRPSDEVEATTRDDAARKEPSVSETD